MSRPKSHLAVLMNCFPGVFTAGLLFRTTLSVMANCRPAVTIGMLSNVSTLPTLVNVCGTGVPSSSQVRVGGPTTVRSTPVALRSSTTVMLCRSLTDPAKSMTVPVAGSNRTGIVSVQVKGTPMVTKGGPGGFDLSIFSTGIRMFWQPALRVLVEPLTNQSLWL